MELKNLIFIGKVYEESDSEWKNGDWYYNFKYPSGRTVSVRGTKTMKAMRFTYGKKYNIRFDKTKTPCFIKSDDFEVLKHGGRIITHSLIDDKYYDATNKLLVDEKFKPIIGQENKRALSLYVNRRRNMPKNAEQRR
jgi:hypothetical protein